MKVKVYENEEAIALAAAELCEKIIREAQVNNPNKIARIVLSTGASQLAFFKEFVKRDIDWSRVEMFHLDEYVGISSEHKASFKKYLLKRFVSVVHPLKAHLIDGTEDVDKTLTYLTNEINSAPIDLGLIGIGENAHIAFNDPPADFEDENAYRIVELSDTCRAQQLREGWFESEDAVFKSAISMTCRQILKCKNIVSVVPYKVKAKAIYDTLTQPINNLVPATLLKEHPLCTLFLDDDSASLIPPKVLTDYIEVTAKK